MLNSQDQPSINNLGASAPIFRGDIMEQDLSQVIPTRRRKAVTFLDLNRLEKRVKDLEDQLGKPKRARRTKEEIEADNS